MQDIDIPPDVAALLHSPAERDDAEKSIFEALGQPALHHIGLACRLAKNVMQYTDYNCAHMQAVIGKEKLSRVIVADSK